VNTRKDRYDYYAEIIKELPKYTQVEVRLPQSWVTGKIIADLWDNYKTIVIKCDVQVNTTGYFDGFGFILSIEDMSLEDLRNIHLFIRKVDK
jgi:hypothetical protein